MKNEINTTLIANRGSPTKATLHDGTEVEKELQIAFFEVGRGWIMMRAIDYYDHFIYLTPADWEGSSFMCTCGSMAVFLNPPQLKECGYGEYDQGHLVCKFHADESANFGFMNAKHATSYVNKKDLRK